MFGWLCLYVICSHFTGTVILNDIIEETAETKGLCVCFRVKSYTQSNARVHASKAHTGKLIHKYVVRMSSTSPLTWKQRISESNSLPHAPVQLSVALLQAFIDTTQGLLQRLEVCSVFFNKRCNSVVCVLLLV